MAVGARLTRMCDRRPCRSAVGRAAAYSRCGCDRDRGSGKRGAHGGPSAVAVRCAARGCQGVCLAVTGPPCSGQQRRRARSGARRHGIRDRIGQAFVDMGDRAGTGTPDVFRRGPDRTQARSRPASRRGGHRRYRGAPARQARCRMDQAVDRGVRRTQRGSRSGPAF